jgi:hypothetical protein
VGLAKIYDRIKAIKEIKSNLSEIKVVNSGAFGLILEFKIVNTEVNQFEIEID